MGQKPQVGWLYLPLGRRPVVVVAGAELVRGPAVGTAPEVGAEVEVVEQRPALVVLGLVEIVVGLVGLTLAVSAAARVEPIAGRADWLGFAHRAAAVGARQVKLIVELRPVSGAGMPLEQPVEF